MNAMKPKIKMKPPNDISGMECPAMYLLFVSLNRSILGPNIIAPRKKLMFYVVNTCLSILKFSLITVEIYLSYIFLPTSA